MGSFIIPSMRPCLNISSAVSFKTSAAFSLKSQLRHKIDEHDMLRQGLIDGIIKEPIGGAHTYPEQIFRSVKFEILKHLSVLLKEDKKELVDKRINKFCSMGVVVEADKE